jgi:competence CoiA-like predicted nuclease
MIVLLYLTKYELYKYMSIHHNITYGIHIDNKNRIFVSDTRPCDKDKIKCEVCDSVLVPKKGNIKIHHYAHKSGNQECDSWAPKFKSENEQNWHILWQNFFKDNEYGDLECVIKKENNNKLKCHRADIITKTNYIIEIQHSNISDNDVKEREEFYGENLIWIIDGRGDNFNFVFYTENNYYIGSYHKEFIYSFERNVFIDTDYGLFELIKTLNNRYCIVKRVNKKLKSECKKLTKCFDKNKHNMNDIYDKLTEYMKNNDLKYNDYNDIHKEIYFCNKFFTEQTNILNVIDKYNSKIRDYLGNDLFKKLFSQVINNNDEFDTFIRKILNQTDFSKNFVKYYDNEYINYEDRAYHLRFNFNADEYKIALDNKQIIELFNDFFDNYRIIILSHEGLLNAYYVSLENYNKINYYKLYYNDVSHYFISVDYTGDGTVNIIKDIIKDIYHNTYENINKYNCLNVNSSYKKQDILNYTNKENNKELDNLPIKTILNDKKYDIELYFDYLKINKSNRKINDICLLYVKNLINKFYNERKNFNKYDDKYYDYYIEALERVYHYGDNWNDRNLNLTCFSNHFINNNIKWNGWLDDVNFNKNIIRKIIQNHNLVNPQTIFKNLKNIFGHFKFIGLDNIYNVTNINVNYKTITNNRLYYYVDLMIKIILKNMVDIGMITLNYGIFIIITIK